MACTGGGAIAVVADPASGETFTGRSLSPRPWLTLGFDDMDRSFALDAYNHPPAYYGGSKYGHLIHFGAITRQLSDRFSSYKMADCTIEVDNNSRLLDVLETTAATQYWQNREGRIYLASDTTIAAGGTPHTLFRGIWRGHKSHGLQRTLTLTDILGSEFSDFNIEDTLPRRTIKQDFPNAPAENLDKVVPIVLGKVSDTAVTVVTGVTAAAFLSPDLTINNLGSNWKMTSAAGTLVYDQNTIPPLGGTAYVWIVPIRATFGGPSLISAYNTSYVTPAGWAFTTEPVGVAVHWSQVADVTSYRIFVADAADFNPLGSKGSATKVRYQDHDNTTFDAIYPSHDFSVTISSWTFGADALGTVATAVTTDTGTGKYAPVYAGESTVSGSLYHTWVVAGHAITDIEELYVDGVRVGITTDEGPFRVPGYAKYIALVGSATYITGASGGRLTVLYGLKGNTLADQAAGLLPSAVPPPTDGSQIPPRLAMNLCGVEDVGDGTGSTITRAPRVVFHLLDQFAIQDYTTGLWAAPSTSDDGIPWLNSATFNAMEAIEIARIGGEGYEAAIVLDEPITIRELLGRLLTSFDMRFGPNEHGQVIAKHLNDFFDLSTAAVITDVQEIIDETSIDRRIEEVENRVRGDCGYRPATKTFDVEGREFEDAVAIANNRGKAVVGDRRQLYYTANQATADDVLGRALTIGKYPPRYVDIVCTLHAIRVKLGDIISVTDVDGIGATGWSGRALWVLGIQTLLNDLTGPIQVRLSCLDVNTFFQEVGVMGDGTVLNNWATDTAAQKAQYLYMCDGTTGLFADGSPGKGMR